MSDALQQQSLARVSPYLCSPLPHSLPPSSRRPCPAPQPLTTFLASSPHLPTAVPAGAPAPPPSPGSGITAVTPASRCVWLKGFPPSVPEHAIRSEVMRYGLVERLYFPPSVSGDEVLITYGSIR